MYRPKRYKTAQASKGEEAVHDPDQIINNVDQDPETMLNPSCNDSMTRDLSPTEPLEIHTSHGLPEIRSFQVQDTQLPGSPPRRRRGRPSKKQSFPEDNHFKETAQASKGEEAVHDPDQIINNVDQDPETMLNPSCNDSMTRDLSPTEPLEIHTSHGLLEIRSFQVQDTELPGSPPRRRRGRPSKKQSFPEDDEEPVNGGFLAQHKENIKSSDEVEFDEMEEVELRDSNGQHGKKGGKIHPRHVWSLQPGVRFVVPLNALDQPVGKGGSVLVRFLKDVAKNGELSPIGEVSWPKVDKSHKADIIALIREKFVLPPRLEIDKNILRHVGNKWRNYRRELKVLYKKTDMTEEQVASAVPKGVVPSQWVKLVQYWFSDKYETLSAKGKEAQASQSHFHTTGSKSFARMRDEFERKHGREPGALEWFVQTHKKKDGTIVEGTSKDFLDTAAAMIAERAPTSPTQRVAIENQVFSELMYSDEDERYQKPVGYGFGVNTKKIIGVERMLRKRGYAQSGTVGEAASFIQSQKLRVKGENMAGDNSAEVDRLGVAMESMSKANEGLQAQLDMQSKQLKKQSKQLQMQSERMDRLQDQLQQVTSLLTKFGGVLNNGGQVHCTPRGVSRLGVDFSDTEVEEKSAESDDGESACSEWDSE